MTQTILAPTSHSLPASATALPPPQAGASVWMPRWRWEAVPSCPRAPTHSAPRSRPSRQGRRSAVAPAPPSGPARRSRQAPAPARRRPAVRSRPQPGPAAYPGRCSPHTPPLAAPSGTSSAATRPQPSGPAWGARAAGPGGGGGPTARPGSRKAPARLRARGQPSAPGAGPEPAVPARPLALGRPPPRAAPRRAAPPPLAALPAPCAARAAPAGSSAGPAHRGRGGAHPAPPLRSAPWPRPSERRGLRAGPSGRGLLKEPRPAAA